MESPPIQKFAFSHPALGDIKGRLISNNTENDIVHFRSIPYATVPARFKQSVLLDHLPDHFDDRPKGEFLQYGAACPQIGGTQLAWFDSYGGRLPGEENIKFDELTCLTLSISVPKSVLESKPAKQLPVMVYVHGGGLSDGLGHVDGLHETTKMAAFSVEEQMPVIMVNIGYRLNWLGFLTCSDLLEEARQDDPDRKSQEDAFNIGLYDQRKAFQWIQNQIVGFGGDPLNITAFGESAGSISLVYHLCSNEPLFQHAILQSGGPFGTMGLDAKDRVYAGLLTELGITGVTAQERLDALRKVPAEKLARSGSGFVSILPYFGPETMHMFPRGAPSYSNAFELVRDCPWIEDFIIGDDHFEGHVFLEFAKAVDAKKVVAVANQAFGEDGAGKLLQEYDIGVDTDANLLWTNVATLLGDIFLSEPMHSLANTIAESGGGKNVYRYHFALTNPFPGSPCYSVTGHHYVEILFLFLTLLHRYPKRRNNFLATQAFALARRWIGFANGKAPWEAYVPVSRGGEGMIAVCDDRAGWNTRTRAEDERISADDPWGERRYRALDMLRAVLERLEKKGKEAGGVDLANMARWLMLNTSAYKADVAVQGV